MAIALVKAGAVAAVSTGTTITPSFGQSTTAGNLLVAVLCGMGTSTGIVNTSSTGWTLIVPISYAGGEPVGIFYKPNCGAAETAPTLSWGTSGPAIAVLAEFSGVKPSTPVDQTSAGGVTGSAAQSPAPQNTAADTTTTDLAIAGTVWNNTKSTTITFSQVWGPTGGTAGHLGDNGSTKALNFGSINYYINAAGGGSFDILTETATPGSGVATLLAGSMASFLPPSTFIADQPNVIGQSIRRSSLY